MTLRRTIFVGFGLAVVVLGLLSIISYQSSADTIASARWVAHTREVLDRLDALVQHVAETEAAYQEFIVTGDSRSLAAPDSAFRDTPPLLAELRQLTDDNPSQQQRLAQVASLVTERLLWSQQLIDTRRSQGLAAARHLGGSRRGNPPALERAVNEMKAAEQLLLEQRTGTLERVTRRTRRFILAGTMFALFVAVLAAFQVNRELRARQKTEQVLRESETRQRALTEGVKDYAIFWLDPEGRVASWNAGAERIHGYRAEEILGESASRFYPVEDSARGKAQEELNAATRDGRVEDEGWRIRRDGSRFWANVVVTAVRNSAGRLLGFAKITRDITERKHGEEALQQYAAQLEAANAELDAFAYSVSHDLRAPLRSIDGFSQALLEDYGDRLDQTAREHLDRVRMASQRMAGLIDDLLGLSRVTRAELHHAPVDLSAMAQSVLEELHARNPKREAEFVVAPGVVVDGDAHLLRIVLENLLCNAWKYTKNRPHTRIEFGATLQDGKRAYYVRDNGAGFDMAYSAKLFGAFQRLHTESEFEGTGIGLATVQRIVQRHGGRVWAEGATGQGATFSFTLGPGSEA